MLVDDDDDDELSQYLLPVPAGFADGYLATSISNLISKSDMSLMDCNNNNNNVYGSVIMT